MGGAVWWAGLAAAPPACFYKLKQQSSVRAPLMVCEPTALFSGLLWHIGFRLGPAWAWAVRSGQVQVAQRGSFGCLSSHVMCALVGRRSVPESDAACRVLRVHLKRIYLVQSKV